MSNKIVRLIIITVVTTVIFFLVYKAVLNQSVSLDVDPSHPNSKYYSDYQKEYAHYADYNGCVKNPKYIDIDLLIYHCKAIEGVKWRLRTFNYNLNSQNYKHPYSTLFSMIVALGDKNLVDVALSLGGDPNTPENGLEEMSPTTVAWSEGHQDIYHYLRSKGGIPAKGIENPNLPLPIKAYNLNAFTEIPNDFPLGGRFRLIKFENGNFLIEGNNIYVKEELRHPEMPEKYFEINYKIALLDSNLTIVQNELLTNPIIQKINWQKAKRARNGSITISGYPNGRLYFDNEGHLIQSILDN